MKKQYSVHSAMDAKDIAIVLDHRERIGRKFDANEIGHLLRDISYRFLRGYRGNFAYVLDMQRRLDQYGKLFAAQSAGVLNCMVAQLEYEMKQGVRQEKRNGLIGQRAEVTIKDGKVTSFALIGEIKDVNQAPRKTKRIALGKPKTQPEIIDVDELF